MEKKHIDIKVGAGLGDIKFGMSRDEIEAILGVPDAKETTSYSEDENELSDSWEYHGLRIDLSFEEAEDWRLSIISISSDDYVLDGKQLIGSDMEELMSELTLLDINDVEIEDLSTEDHPDHILVSSEEKGINFWLSENVVEEIQWGPLFADDDTIIWP